MSFFSKCFKPVIILLNLAIIFSGCSESLNSQPDSRLLLLAQNSNTSVIKSGISISIKDIYGNTLKQKNAEQSTLTRSAAPGVFTQTWCYAALVKEGITPANSDLKKLTFQDSQWYYQLDSDYIIKTGNYELYIFAADSENYAKSIQKAPLMTKIKVTLTQNELNYSVSGGLYINPSATENGKINLIIKTTAASTLKHVVSSITENETEYLNSECLSQNITSSQFNLKSDSIPPGNYTLTMKFYDKQNGNILFFLSEPLTVWSGCTTNKWFRETGTALSELEVSPGLISSTFFVRGKSPVLFGTTIPAETGSNTATGGITSPLLSVQEAVNRIKLLNDQSTTYTIYLDGTEELSSTINVNPTKNLKLFITSLSGNASQTVIDGKDNVQCLNVGTAGETATVTLNIKNVTVKNGKSENGAGLYIESNAAVTMKGCTIDSCEATNDGGGAYVKGNLSLEDSTIQGNSASGNGGAVYNDGIFSIGGTITAPAGTDYENDVYLADGKIVTVKDNIVIPTEDTQLIAITPSELKRGTVVAEAENPDNLDLSQYKFNFTITKKDDGWETDFTNSLVLDAPIYIAGEGFSVCEITGSDTDGTGSRSKPFASLTRAASEINDENIAFKIKIDGTIPGAQTIPSSVKASQILIEGANSDNSKDILDGGFSASKNGTTLTLRAPVTVSLKNLRITGGYDASTIGGGGGIYSASNLILETGVLITDNYTLSNGAGIYNNGKTITIKDGVEIINNHNETTTTGCGGGGLFNYAGIVFIKGGKLSGNTSSDGGGIYNSDEGKIFICGSTVIGGEDEGNSAQARNNNFGQGGGIYNDSEGILYLGYDSPDDGSTVTPADWTGAISYNSAARGAGGVYANTDSSIFMNNGEIFSNTSESSGGGLTVKGSITMSGGSIHDNTKGSTGYGNNIYTNSGSINISGAACIYNGDVTLKDGDKINVAGKLIPPEDNANGITALINTQDSLSAGIEIVNLNNDIVNEQSILEQCSKFTVATIDNTTFVCNTKGQTAEATKIIDYYGTETIYPTILSALEAIKKRPYGATIILGRLTAEEFGNTETVEQWNNSFPNSFIWAIKQSNCELNLTTGFTIVLKKNCYGLFNNCSNLIKIDLSKLDTSNVTNMSQMFYRCFKMTSLDISNFNTTNVTDMSCMFYVCDKIEEIDLSSFDFPKITNMEKMFFTDSNGTTYLHRIYAKSGTDLSSNDNLSNQNIFDGYRGLYGKNGDHYTYWVSAGDNRQYKDFARVDSTSSPGYFSVKE